MALVRAHVWFRVGGGLDVFLGRWFSTPEFGTVHLEGGNWDIFMLGLSGFDCWGGGVGWGGVGSGSGWWGREPASGVTLRPFRKPCPRPEVESHTNRWLAPVFPTPRIRVTPESVACPGFVPRPEVESRTDWWPISRVTHESVAQKSSHT